MIFDLHCDTLWKIQNTKDGSLQKDSFLQIDEEKLFSAGYFAQCFAMYVPADTPMPKRTLDELIARYYQELVNCERIRPVLAFDDFARNRAEGKISAVLTMEDACPLCGDIGNLYAVHKKGVKMIALTWNFPTKSDIQITVVLSEVKSLICSHPKRSEG